LVGCNESCPTHFVKIQKKFLEIVHRKTSKAAADKIYELVVSGPRGLRPRQGEKLLGLCARVHRLYLDAFNSDVPNPWRGVTKNRRTKAIKPAVTRYDVYVFANTAIAAGYSEAGAAAVICFEWLQRPENVLAGFIRWTDYLAARPPRRSASRTIRLARRAPSSRGHDRW
jgi:hypothetical protein